MKTEEWTITLDGGAGELDRRTVSIPDGMDSDKAEELIRDAVIDMARATIFDGGDTIRISRLYA